MKKKVLISVVLLFALVLASCKSEPKVTEEAVIKPGETIKIGMGSPMTGGDAAFGIDAENSGKLAVADFGDVEGFSFELLAEDDGGTADGGAAVANKLVADTTLVGVAGHLFSGATAAAAPIYEKYQVVMLSPSATNPDLTKQGWTVFNRVPFTDALQGSAAADYIYGTLGFRKIAVLHDGEDYGKGLATILKDSFEALGGEVTAFEGIVSKEADYTPILTTIAADEPELLYFGGYTQDGAVLTNQMKTSGLEDAVFFGCDGTFGTDYLDRAGENAEGSYHATPRTPPATDAKAKFDADYLAAYGTGPGELSPFSWNSYDCTTAIMEMVEKVAYLDDDGNLRVPRAALVDGIRNLENWTGISGTYSCAPVGDCNIEGPQFHVVQDGEFVAVN